MTPGPFSLLPQSVLAFPQASSDLVTFTHDELGDLDADLGEVTRDLLQLHLFANEPGDPLDGTDLTGMFDSLAAAPMDSFAEDQATIAQGISDGDTFFNTAAELAPQECFLEQPAPFDPSADPSVNLNYGNGAQDGGPGAPPPNVGKGNRFNLLNGSPLYQFTLTNLTQFNADYFNVTDTFKLTIDGPPNVTIHVKTWHDGQLLGDVVVGQADQRGHFELQGVEGPDNVGAWSEEWYGNDVLIQAVAFFVIAPSQ